MIQISKTTKETEPNPAHQVAAEICKRAPSVGPWPLPPTATESADAYFARLVELERLEEAIRFIAICLDPRQVTWWGCLCVWESLKTAKQPIDQATVAVDAAVAWVLDPKEAARQALKPIADRLPPSTPAGALAMATFWSGGNISLPDCPEVLPPGDACHKLVACAVVMATAAADGKRRKQSQRQALRMAAEIQAGQVPWLISANTKQEFSR